MSKEYKIRTKNKNVFLRVRKGHFATMHSHINYYIDVTTQKTRLSEASAVAKEMVSAYRARTIVDTILCLDGTEVIGACVAEELTRDDFINLNAHQTIYVISPEFIGGGQMIFRDNLVPMLANKHVLILAASVLTQLTTTADISLEFRRFSQPLTSATAIRFTQSSTPTTLEITRALSPTSARFAKEARKSRRLLTATDTPHCDNINKFGVCY